MNASSSAPSLILLLIGCAAQHAAAQSTARVTVSGRVDAGTCTVTVPATLTLDAIRRDAFPASVGEQTAGASARKAFNVELASCVAVAGATIQVQGTAAASYFANTTGAGRATSVGIRVGRSTNGDTLVGANSSFTHPVNGPVASIPLYVSYARTYSTAIGVGTVSIPLTISVTYH